MPRHLWIAGVDRWPDYIRDSLSIEQVLTYQTDACRFRVRGEKPQEGDEVIVEDDSIGRLFAGIIVKVDLADTMPDRSTNVWQVEADDYCVLLDRRLVVETYQNMPADAIFRDICLKYCPGFTTNGVRSGAPTVEFIVFDYVPVSEAFRQLCDYVGWHWQPSYTKDLAFFSVDDLAAPAPMKLVPGGYFRNLKHTIDQTGLRNRVYVRGGTMLSDPWTYEVKADGSARAWVLPHKPHDLSITVGGATKTVGIENVDDEATKDFLMNFEEKYVRASAQTPTPAAGTTISFTYRYDIDVITMVEDTDSQKAIAAIQGGDGVYEHVIVDDSLTTIEAAEAAGQADLREHSNPQVKGSFDTEIPGWAPGQLVEIDLPDRGIQGTFLVQKVTLTPATTDKWTWHVEYGGRLKGLPDFLKALVSAQQKKRQVDTSILHKVNVLPDSASVVDEIIFTPRTTGWEVEQSVSVSFSPGENVAVGKIYTKNLSPKSSYPDTNNAEFTDGIEGSSFSDGKSFGYTYTELGVADGGVGTLEITIDLGVPTWINQATLASGDGDSTKKYEADTLEILTSSDGTTFVSQGAVGTLNVPMRYLTVSFSPVKARYVKFRIRKQLARTGNPGDWLFIMEGYVYKVYEEIVTVGSLLNIWQVDSGAWVQPQYQISTDGGQTWGNWISVDPAQRGYIEVPHPCRVRVKANSGTVKVRNWKKPFDETDTVCGFVVCS